MAHLPVELSVDCDACGARRGHPCTPVELPVGHVVHAARRAAYWERQESRANPSDRGTITDDRSQ